MHAILFLCACDWSAKISICGISQSNEDIIIMTHTLKCYFDKAKTVKKEKQNHFIITMSKDEIKIFLPRIQGCK